MYRILHFSDLHLEMPFKSSRLPSSYGTWRRQDLRATLGRILTIGRERKVDAITIAGDLFEQEYIMPEMAGFLSTQFGKADPIRVIIAPGEKDPYTTESIYSLTRWPKNVVIFNQSKLTKVDLTDEIKLWGAACPPTRDHNLLENLSLEKDQINLLLLHAHCNEDQFSSHRNIHSLSLEDLLNKDFIFSLLGSSHRTRALPDTSIVCVYPGSPEPFDIESEDIGHHIVLVQIQGKECKHELIPINRWRYIDQVIDVTGFRSEAQAIRSIEKIVQKSSSKDDERYVYRIALNGETEIPLNLEELITHIKTEALFELFVDSQVDYDLEVLAQEPTVRGTLVKRYLEHETKGQERNKEFNALKLALQALDGTRIGL
jgi:exonuclease SbcD